MHRCHWSAQERAVRSRLAQIVHGDSLVSGCLVRREVKCGKPGCKCNRGEKHVALYLVYTQEGKCRQIYVPREWEERVRKWIQQFRTARGLLRELSQMHRRKIVDRKV